MLERRQLQARAASCGAAREHASFDRPCDAWGHLSTSPGRRSAALDRWDRDRRTTVAQTAALRRPCRADAASERDVELVRSELVRSELVSSELVSSELVRRC